MQADDTAKYDAVGEMYLYDIDQDTESIEIYYDGESSFEGRFEINYAKSLGVNGEGSNTVIRKETKETSIEPGSNNIKIDSKTGAVYAAVKPTFSKDIIVKNNVPQKFLSYIIVTIFFVVGVVMSGLFGILITSEVKYKLRED